MIDNRNDVQGRPAQDRPGYEITVQRLRSLIQSLGRIAHVSCGMLGADFEWIEEPGANGASDSGSAVVMDRPALRKLIRAAGPETVSTVDSLSDGTLVAVVAINDDGHLYGYVCAGVQSPDEPSARQTLLESAVGIAEEVRQTLSDENGRTMRMQRLSDVDHSLLDCSDIDGALQCLLEAAVEVAGSDTGEITVLNQTGDRLEIRAAYGIFESQKGEFLDASQGVSALVLETGKPIMVDDLQARPEYQELLHQHDTDEYGELLRQVRAAYKLPILRENTTIGVLCLHSFDAWDLDGRRIRVLRYLADRIATVLAGHRVTEIHIQAASQILEVAQQKTRTVAEREVVRKELYKILADVSLLWKPVKYACVREYDPRTRRLRYVGTAGEGWPAGLTDRGWRYEEGGGHHAARSGKTYALRKVASAKYYHETFSDVKSHISIPIYCGGEVDLVWTLESDVSSAFFGETRKSLEWVADITASILEVLRQATARAAAEFEQICTKARTIDALSNRVAKVFRDFFDTDGCFIFLKTPAGDAVELVGKSGEQDFLLLPRRCEMRYSLEEVASCTAHVVAEKQTVHIPDMDNRECYPAHQTALWDYRIKRTDGTDQDPSTPVPFLGVPIRGTGNVLGVVRYSSRSNNAPYIREEVELAERLAERLGLAIERIRFARRMAVARKLSQTAPLETVETAANRLSERAREQLRSSSVHIRILEGNHLRLVGSSGDKTASPPLRKLGESFSGYVAQAGSIVNIPDTDADERWANLRRDAIPAGRKQSDWIKSMACAPLVTGEDQPTLVGTISFHSRDADRFGSRDLAEMEEIARHSALVLQHARLHERQMRLNVAMKIAGEELVNHPDSVTVVSVAGGIARAFSSLIPQATASVWICDQSKSELKCVATHATRHYACPDFQNLLTDACVDCNDAIISRFMNRRKPKWGERIDEINDIEYARTVWNDDTDRFVDNIATFGIGPIWLGNELLGCIFAYVNAATLSASGIPKDLHDDFSGLTRYAGLVLEAVRSLERSRTAMGVAAPLAMMGSLLDAFLHHLVQPLHGMRVHLSNARADVDAGRSAADSISWLERECNRSEDTVQDLKRLITGRGFSTRTAFDVGATVRKVTDRLSVGLPRSVETLVEIPAKPLYVDGLEPIIEQAVRMVCDNALEAIGDQGRLTVAVRQEQDSVVIEAKDTGVGMSQAAKDACIKPFFTTKEKGSGMGLSVASAACDWHKGQLEIDSELHVGTTVTFRLPIAGGSS